MFSYISHYSTAHSSDAAYIIGGFNTPDPESRVFAFRDDQWNQLDNLNKGRDGHGSITVGSQTMIVGGYFSSGYEWVIILRYNFGYGDSDFLRFETEVWELENGNNKVITPTLSGYYDGVGLYAVHFNFCSYWVFKAETVLANKLGEIQWFWHFMGLH